MVIQKHRACIQSVVVLRINKRHKLIWLILYSSIWKEQIFFKLVISDFIILDFQQEITNKWVDSEINFF